MIENHRVNSEKPEVLKLVMGNAYTLPRSATVLDLKKLLEQTVVDLPTPQQRLTLLRTEKRLGPDEAVLVLSGPPQAGA